MEPGEKRRIHKGSPTIHILSKIYSIFIDIYFFKSHSDIVLSTTPNGSLHRGLPPIGLPV